MPKFCVRLVMTAIAIAVAPITVYAADDHCVIPPMDAGNPADLSGHNFQGCELIGASLGGRNLSGAKLGHTVLVGADLSGANLTNAELGDANLSGANLEGAQLVKADLYHANFASANLRGASVKEAKAKDAIFDGADVERVNWYGANIGSRSTFVGVKNLDCSSFLTAYGSRSVTLDKSCE